MKTIFGFLVQKIVGIPKFIDPAQLFQKLSGLPFLQFSTLTSMTSLVSARVTNSKEFRRIQTLVTHEIMEILNYFFWQKFLIFDALSDSCKTSQNFPGPAMTILGPDLAQTMTRL